MGTPASVHQYQAERHDIRLTWERCSTTTHTHTPQRAGDACCRQVYMIVMDEAQIYLKGKEGKGPCNDRCATMVSFLARAQYDVVLLYPRH